MKNIFFNFKTVLLFFLIPFIFSCAYHKERSLKKFMLAARNGRVRVIKRYLNRGTSVDATCDMKQYVLMEYETTALFEASKNGKDKVVKILFDNGASIDNKALHEAVNKNHYDVVKLFFENGAEVNESLITASEKSYYEIIKLIINEYKLKINEDTLQQALFKASENKNEKIVEILLENGADINKKNYYGKNTLSNSIYYGRDKNVKLMTKKYFDILTEESKQDALYTAVDEKEIEITEILLKKGIDPNYDFSGYGYNRKSVLLNAVYKDYEEILKILIKYGADYKSADEENRTPLYYAAKWFSYECIKLLMKKGLKIDGEVYEALSEQLLIASYNGSSDKIKKILALGIDINTVISDFFHFKWSRTINVNYSLWGPLYYPQIFEENSYHSTALIEAASRGRVRIVKYLIKNGADIDKKNDGELNFFPAAVQAAGNGRYNVVKILIDEGAVDYDMVFFTAIYTKTMSSEKIIKYIVSTYPELIKKYGNDLIFKVISDYSDKIAELFFNNGVSYNYIDPETGKNCLMVSVESGKNKILELLIPNVKDINQKDHEGKTALMYAAQKGYATETRILLESGADINAISNNGNSALMYAVKFAHIDITEYLIENNADIKIKNKKNMNALSIANSKIETDYKYEEIISLLESKMKIEELKNGN